MNANYLIPVFSSIGLILDMWGVWGLYKYKIKGLNKIYQTPIVPKETKVISEGHLKIMLLQVIEDINYNITTTNIINREADKKTLIFFVAIVLGFLFQLIAAILSFTNISPISD